MPSRRRNLAAEDNQLQMGHHHVRRCSYESLETRGFHRIEPLRESIPHRRLQGPWLRNRRFCTSVIGLNEFLAQIHKGS
jgi:hypothetical protein